MSQQRYKYYYNRLVDMQDDCELETKSVELMKRAEFDFNVTAGEFYQLCKVRNLMVLRMVRRNG